MSARADKRLLIGRVIALGLVFVWLAATPAGLIERGPTICVFKNLFQRECAGCGMTRALSSVVHGDLAAALRYNKLGIIVFSLLCLVFLRDVASVFDFGRNSRARACSDKVPAR
jgi:hypothetical protein